jgi:hypothetical protein
MKPWTGHGTDAGCSGHKYSDQRLDFSVWPSGNHLSGLAGELAKRAKELNLDMVYDTVHEMARDEN